jgi:TolB protein
MIMQCQMKEYRAGRSRIALAMLAAVLAACADQPTGVAPSTAVSSTPSFDKGGSGGKPQRNRIAFARGELGTGVDIYTMNPDGTGVVRLTTSAPFAASDEPAWSPDARKIAFRSSRDANAELYVMNADGSGVVRLTNNAYFDEDPVWSPDGTQIAFASARGSDFLDIYVMNADGTNQRRLTQGGSTFNHPAWSPDGKIYYDGPGGIFRMNADGSDKTGVISLLPDNVFAPAISPDGTTIAFRSDRDRGSVWVASLANPLATAYPLLDTMGGKGDPPSWGPDGQTLVFTFVEVTGGPEIPQVLKYNPVTGGGLLTGFAIPSLNPAWSR